jgi:hypothetical protein
MFKFLLSLFILLAVSQQGFCWGVDGHRIIAEIAFKYLNNRTRNNILSFLDGMSIEDASNWMDDVRGDYAYNYTKPYHYADFEKGQPATKINGNNIIGVLDSTFVELDNIKKLSRTEIKIRLLYLFHLIGDLHHPLHVGYAEDRGGNTYQVSFFGHGSNLHKCWDTEIINYKNISLQDVLSANTLTPQHIKSIQHINLVVWANESRSLLDRVYSIQGHKISEEYINSAYPVIEKQLLYAGLRLAAVLEKYFDY